MIAFYFVIGRIFNDLMGLPRGRVTNTYEKAEKREMTTVF